MLLGIDEPTLLGRHPRGPGRALVPENMLPTIAGRSNFLRVFDPAQLNHLDDCRRCSYTKMHTWERRHLGGILYWSWR